MAGSIRPKGLTELRTQLVSTHGAPRCLRSNNGPEFVSRAIREWLAAQGIETALIDPGKPWQNAADEPFNGKPRDQCPSLEWFRSRAEARVVIEHGRRHRNAVRAHSSLESSTPHECRRQRQPLPNRAAFQTNEWLGNARAGQQNHALRRAGRAQRCRAFSLIAEKAMSRGSVTSVKPLGPRIDRFVAA